jgi:hypothetical protein
MRIRSTWTVAFRKDETRSTVLYFPFLAVSRVAVAGRIGFLTVDILARLGAPVPPHAFLMVDAGVRVQPNDGVVRAVGLRRGFAREQLKRTRGHGWLVARRGHERRPEQQRHGKNRSEKPSEHFDHPSTGVRGEMR